MDDFKCFLANDRWLIRATPFWHIRATDVLGDAAYAQLTFDTSQVLRGRFFDQHCFELTTGHDYDADIFVMEQRPRGPLGLFASPKWYKLLSDILGIETTEDISIAIHHHHPHSRVGTIHNDLNPGWFAERDSTEPNLASSKCNYKTGKSRQSNGRIYERIRAATMIFYLNNNPSWTSDDGGETGLYISSSDDHTQPSVAVPPVNNSLLMFKCTPFSFHTFMPNGNAPRTSIIMWFHSQKRVVTRQWGNNCIVGWPHEV